MEPTQNVPLGPLTSLGTGGAAEQLYTCSSTTELQSVLAKLVSAPWILGYGSNALVSDHGLPGVTVLIHSDNITLQEGLLITDAGAWWDDVVQEAIGRELWGLELMSAIPGGVGAAIVGNIAAYGQAVADTLAWVEVYDTATHELRRLRPEILQLSYRSSAFQTDEYKNLVITRAAFMLQSQASHQLTYQSALDIATELGLNTDTLAGRRQTILETRKRAGSLWDYRRTDEYLQTAGSFFRNPLVSTEDAERIMAYDETGKSTELLKKMNLVHGGDQKRVSAAHVLLAAGFTRGQTWGSVRLHPSHILKIENTGDATAQQIYDVAQEIIQTVKKNLGIDIVPEVRFLGDFSR